MAERELDLTVTPQAATLEAWEALARKALGGRSPGELATLTDDGIKIAPLGTRRDWPAPDASGIPGLPPYTRGTRAAGNGTWDVRQAQADPDPAAANGELLEDLAHGGTSAWLKLDRGARSGEAGAPEDGDGILIRTAADLERVLEGISRETPIAFDAGVAALPLGRMMLDRPGTRPALFINHDVFASLAAHGLVTGSIDQELAEAAALAQRLDATDAISRAIGIDTRPYHNAGASPAQEIAIATASGVAYLRALTAAGLGLDAAARHIAFILVTDADFLVSIAKLRAMRRIWARVLDACGSRAAMAGLHLTAVTSDLMMTRRSPHTNILRMTVATFAAALGGADAISVLPFTARVGPATPNARRIARNTQAILMEEAQLARVLDPLGGSFAGERFTEDLAVKAWALFQDIENRGGMAVALTSFIRERISQSWELRRTRISERRELITGVSDFPLLNEALEELAAPKQKILRRKQLKSDILTYSPIVQAAPPLPVHHLDEDFEALRAASDRHVAAAGERPKIALICIGTETDHAARESFARTLFESGGIKAVRCAASDAQSAAVAFLDSGIRIAALASSDAIYAQHALAFAHEVKRTGARYLYFIGAPGELEAALLEAGVDAFVAEGADAIALLRRAHTTLGLRE